MKHVRFALLLPGLIAALAGCASDLTQGYRSTPDYPAYASATCASAGMTQALNEATENYLERETGMDIKGYGPGGTDLFNGMVMAFVFALAEDRPPGLGDACAGLGTAQAASARQHHPF
ncbi:MAG: hypothetical protein B7X53_10075 [Hyphomonas sp. 34-62-18]|nr:hypothetical protein [Hyphomonas sp. 34-62-18]OZB15952.1 MAG: hypothetical protein B7X53_10075 [Hyphomonas sp. 34-62-18]